MSPSRSARGKPRKSSIALFFGSSPVTVGRFRGRSSAQARQKGAAPTTFAFASPRICEGDAKAKAEGANRIYRERVENTDHQFERQIQPAFRMLESPCFASDSRLSVRFSPTVTGDEAYFETPPTGLVPVESGLCTTRCHGGFEVVQSTSSHPGKQGGDSKQSLAHWVPR